MDDRCFGEDYNSKFDSLWYLSAVYSAESFFLKEGSYMQKLHDVISQIDVIDDGKMLEFGCGPTVHTAMVASRIFKNITMADYAKPNRDMIEAWLRKEQAAFDWSPFAHFVANLEQVSSDSIENRTRAAIQEVIACDVTKDNILLTPQWGPFNLVMSTLCLEAACGDIGTYKKTITNLCSLIKPGGKLWLSGVFGETFYMVNDYKFFCLYLTEDDIQQTVQSAGMAVESFTFTHIDEIDEYCDHEGFFYMLATKKA